MAITLPTERTIDRQHVRPAESIARSVAVLALAVGLTVAVLATLSSVIGGWTS